VVAGFIGSHVVDRLLADGVDVVGYDNFTAGGERSWLRNRPPVHLETGKIKSNGWRPRIPIPEGTRYTCASFAATLNVVCL
jgi:nucleoside-diphosphate-sugar epimerase